MFPGLAIWFLLVPYCFRIFERNFWSKLKILMKISFQSLMLNGVSPRVFTQVVDWVRAHRQVSREFEDQGSSTWVFFRIWQRKKFIAVVVAVIHGHYEDLSSHLIIADKIICALGSGATLFYLCGRSHTLMKCYRKFFGINYTKVCSEYLVFVVPMLERCLQITVFFVFGTLDALSMTEFPVNLFEGAENCDWMKS